MFVVLFICWGKLRFGCIFVSYLVICLVDLIGEVDLRIISEFFFNVGVIDLVVDLINIIFGLW